MFGKTPGIAGPTREERTAAIMRTAAERRRRALEVEAPTGGGPTSAQMEAEREREALKKAEAEVARGLPSAYGTEDVTRLLGKLEQLDTERLSIEKKMAEE